MTKQHGAEKSGLKGGAGWLSTSRPRSGTRYRNSLPYRWLRFVRWGGAGSGRFGRCQGDDSSQPAMSGCVKSPARWGIVGVNDEVDGAGKEGG